MSEKLNPSARTLARVLLRRLLLAYAFFAVALTGLQLFQEYRSVRQEVRGSLESLVSTFAPGAEAAIWDYQASLLNSMVSGIGAHPMVVAVDISDTSGTLRAAWKATDGQEASPKLRIQRPLYHLRDGHREQVGMLTIASSETFVWTNLRGTFFSIVLSSFISLLFLISVLWLLVRFLVVNPLVRFSAQVSALAESGQEKPIDLGKVNIAEISTLQLGFNRLMQRLADSHTHIAQQNAELEQRVVARTHELENSEARFRSIFERANAGILFTDATGNILQCNSAFAQMLGFRDEELIGINILALTHPDDLPQQTAFTDEMRKGFRNDYRRQKRYLTPQQKTIWVDLAVTALRDEEGRVTNFVGLMTDITDRVHAEEALQSAMRTAEGANRAKSEFLANMSHEIRTPMNAILGLTQLVLETELQPMQQDFLKKAHASAQSLLAILNDILDYSKIEAGRMEVERVPFHIETLLRAAADLFGGNMADKDLELFIEIGAEVPDEVLGDPLRLAQVINNLLGNAIKFTDRGEIHIKLEVLAFDESTLTLRCAVRDTGIGIPQEKIGQLFAAFAQADSSITRKYGGTGLGLAICHELVQLMGGELIVSSVEGQGATFSFTFCVGVTDRRFSDANLSGFKGKNAMVVDDHETSRRILQNLLETWGLKVETATNGEEGLERILAAQRYGHGFNVIILDADMDGLNGLDVAKRLDEADGTLDTLQRIIMVNAHEREVVKLALGATRVDGLLSKPVIASELMALLNGKEVVGQGEAEQGPAQLEMQFFTDVRVLLVEDNLINQQVAAEFLKKRGFSVTLADDGVVAVEKAMQERFDVVLMDLQMPRMNGLDASVAIRKLPGCADLPIIAMTAAVLAEDRERCTAAGMVDFVAKPMDQAELTQVLQRWVKRDLAPPVRTDAGIRGSESSGEESLPTLSGFDLARALRRFDGDRVLLDHVLQEFVETYRDAQGKIDILLAEDDREAAKFLLHTLKGVASNIGATVLANAAKVLEDCLKRGDAAINPAAKGDFAQALADALAAIQASQPTSMSTTGAATATDRSVLLQLLIELRPYLQERELVPDALATELRRQLENDVPERLLTKLMRQLDKFDHDGALTSINQLATLFDLELPK